MKTIQGDLIKLALNGKFDVIVHGCNCFCTMGAGIARQIASIFPEAYTVDCLSLKGDITKLGTYTYAKERNVIVVNAYTQYGIGNPNIVSVNYDAVRECFRKIRLGFAGKRIGIPKIGAGLAGGNWTTIEKIIDEEMQGEDITVVEYCDGKLCGSI